MKKTFAGLMILLTVALAISAHADIQSKAPVISSVTSTDITVLSPRQYQVFQRRTRLDGSVLVSGQVKPSFDKLQVRITGKSLNKVLPGKWRPLPYAKQAGTFTDYVATPAGGWYKVEFRALKGRKVVAQAEVANVGVGEVFVGAGQSNSTNYGEERLKPTSGFVSSFDGTQWRLANDPQPGTHDHSGGGSFWPAFGDAMYARFGVPIGVAVTGHGGTTVLQWQPDSSDGLFPWMMTRIYQLGVNGFRAVLWHQGENDVNTDTDVYVERLGNVIRRSNADAGWEFPWFVAQVSYQTPQRPSFPLVRAAQQKLWDLGIALQGPDTDTLTGDNRDNHGNGIHLSGKGERAHGKMWADKVGAYLDSILGPPQPAN